MFFLSVALLLRYWENQKPASYDFFSDFVVCTVYPHCKNLYTFLTSLVSNWTGHEAGGNEGIQEQVTCNDTAAKSCLSDFTGLADITFGSMCKSIITLHPTFIIASVFALAELLVYKTKPVSGFCFYVLKV